MRNTELVDLSPLAEFNLIFLDLDGCVDLSDLRPLSTQSQLHSLDIRACPNIYDLTPLRDLNSLQTLYLGSPHELDLGPLPRDTLLHISLPPNQAVRNADGLVLRYRRTGSYPQA